jgi:hypothetical protein
MAARVGRSRFRSRSRSRSRILAWLLDLGPTARRLFVAAWLAAQATLVATAGLRADHAYGFRMFEESSTVELRLSRELDDGGLLPIDDDWEARDCTGALHHFSWSERVRLPAPERLGLALPAPYGAGAAEAQARAAVAWVAAHTPDDCQTLGFRAELRLRRNGLELQPISFTVRRPGAADAR